ncbi:MAG: tetratricopeptide repeat protein, partial [Bacteroidota bacterium]
RTNRDLYLKRIQKGPTDSPWHLYAQANIRLQWALLKFKFGDYFAGFWDVRKAYQLLEKNKAAFPNFLPNEKDYGVLQLLIGNVPDQYQWGIRNLAGLKGEVKAGEQAMLKMISCKDNQYQFLQQETLMIYSYLLLFVAHSADEAWNLLQENPLHKDQHVLAAFTSATVAARSGRNDYALQTLQKVQQSPGWKQFPFLEYRLGNLLLKRLDVKAAQHFNNYLATNRGQSDIKSTYLRLGWCALLRGDDQAYDAYLKKVIAEGSSEIGRDKDAFYASQLGFTPDVVLVKARLLFDGGYYEQALEQLLPFEERNFSSIYEKLEWQYRLARIWHELGKVPQALEAYQEVYLRGKQQAYYFSCNAALQIGRIKEDQQDWTGARTYYKACLNLKPEIYRNSLHLAAKAGLQRIKEKT